MSADDVLEKIRAIEVEADEILSLISDRPVSRAVAAEAQELFRELKLKLKSEYERMSTIRGEATLSQVESHFYLPAVADAWTNAGVSSVRWDSHPDSKWRDAIGGVRDYMRYWSSGLRKLTASEQPN